MQKKALISVLTLSVFAVGGIAFLSTHFTAGEVKAAGGPAAAAMIPQVPVAEVIIRTITPTAEFTGFLAAPKSVELRSRVSGAIDAVSVPEGSLVKKGQMLFQIDPRPFQVALDTASAQLRQAEVLASQAQSDFNRAERLVASGAVSRKTYDDAVSRRNERQAQVQAAQAAVAAAKLDLSFARVTAPISGRVDRILVTEGNLVTGGSTGAASLLTTIVSVDPVYAYFDVDEATYLQFVRGARPDRAAKDKGRWPVQVALTTDKGFPHQGELDFLSNQVDRSSGTVRARAVVRNPDGLLAPGLFARAKVATGSARETVLIDDQAVGTDQGRNYVLILGAENKVQYRPVELGPIVDGLRVVNSGLKQGESIIIKGLVRPGMQVAPKKISMLPQDNSEKAAAKPNAQGAS